MILNDDRNRWLVSATCCWLTLIVIGGCGQANVAATKSVTIGGEVSEVKPAAEVQPVSHDAVADTKSTGEQTPEPTSAAVIQEPVTEKSASATSTPSPDEPRTFKVEGPEEALRVSYDDFDLLKVMNLDPVPADAPERLPKWLKALDGRRIRVRGFMYPPFQDKDIRGFVLARDNQICCFGRTPKEYDLVDVFLRKGVTTYYIQNRPFDVVGTFKIKTEIEQFTAMYELEDAVVIEK